MLCDLSTACYCYLLSDLSNNQFAGEIPKTIANLGELVTLFASFFFCLHPPGRINMTFLVFLGGFIPTSWVAPSWTSLPTSPSSIICSSHFGHSHCYFNQKLTRLPVLFCEQVFGCQWVHWNDSRFLDRIGQDQHPHLVKQPAFWHHSHWVWKRSHPHPCLHGGQCPHWNCSHRAHQSPQPDRLVSERRNTTDESSTSVTLWLLFVFGFLFLRNLAYNDLDCPPTDYSFIDANDYSVMKNACDLHVIILATSIGGGILLLLICGGLIFYCVRRKLTPQYESIQ